MILTVNIFNIPIFFPNVILKANEISQSINIRLIRQIMKATMHNKITSQINILNDIVTIIVNKV